MLKCEIVNYTESEVMRVLQIKFVILFQNK